ncbi:MAG: nucleoside triphosphate pyrophosphohydrolase [Parvibaculales bacterium]
MNKKGQNIEALLNIMAALRTPETGCPWDLEQDFKSIAPYTLEEAYEVTDAIEREDMDDLKDELGDLLLQVVFHARMAEEQGLFSFEDVVDAISTKMIRRHPHVFSDADANTATEVKQSWEAIKQAEKAEKGKLSTSLLGDVPTTLPGLTRAVKLQKRAAKIGFDWQQAEPIFDKLTEELEELKVAIAAEDQDNVEEEYGDMLFVMANLARHLNLDPETAIRRGNRKFVSRFSWMEEEAKVNSLDLNAMTLEELESLWQAAKHALKTKISG